MPQDIIILVVTRAAALARHKLCLSESQYIIRSSAMIFRLANHFGTYKVRCHNFNSLYELFFLSSNTL